MKIFFVINPKAGTRHKSGDETIIAGILALKNIHFKIGHTSGPGSALSLARKAVDEGYDIVVASGGDGTVNEVAKAVLNSDAAMAIIPRGSGNGLARYHQIPFRIDDNLNMILRNNRVWHDAIHVNDHISVNVSGIGFDAHVASLFGKDGTRGLTGYAKLVIGEFRRYLEREIVININGETHQRKMFLLAIANSTQFGNNAFIAPAASTSDGLADLTIVRKMPLLKMPGFALKVFSKSVYQSPYAERFEASELSISSNDDIALHIDGEPAGAAKEFHVKVVRNAFKMIVP
jgi:YegS/Rv2252/BmrU family lipid kinase